MKNPDKLTKVLVEVTERHIKNGTVNDSTDCPFVRALMSVLATKAQIVADYDEILLEFPNSDTSVAEFIIDTPAKVSKFMKRIDATDPDTNDGPLPPAPKPFTVTLRIPNKFLRPKFQS